MKELKDEISRLHAENAALQQGYDAAVDALKDMAAEFRALDLPYGSKAYAKAIAVIYGHPQVAAPTAVAVPTFEDFCKRHGLDPKKMDGHGGMWARVALDECRAITTQPAPQQAELDAVAGQDVMAWMTQEGDRVVTARTMGAARRSGGAMLSSLRYYSVALVRANVDAAMAAQGGK